MEASALVPAVSGRLLWLLGSCVCGLLFLPTSPVALAVASSVLFVGILSHGPHAHAWRTTSSPNPSHITLAQTALVATVKKMHRTMFGFHFKVKPRTKKGRQTMDAAGTAQVIEGGSEGEGEISLATRGLK